jgi:hypothetical protein
LDVTFVGGCLVPEKFGQSGAPSRDTRPHGAPGNPEDHGDLVVFQIHHVSEHHRDPVVLGELPQKWRQLVGVVHLIL